MLKRLVEDFDDPTSEFESKNKRKKIESKHERFSLFTTLSCIQILDTILSYVDSPTTQLNFLSSCKQSLELRKSLPKKHLYEIHHAYYSSSSNVHEMNDKNKQAKAMLYRLDGFLRNLYIAQGVEFSHPLMIHDIEETLGKVNCHSLNAHNFYFKSGLIEVLGFYCDDYYHSEDEDSGDDEREEEEDIYSSIHVKFFTCANEPVVLHQNVKLTRGVGHYYLARELNDSSLEKLVEISQKRIFDSSFDNLLFTIRGNFQMEVFFRIMLGIAGVKKIDRYLDCILSSYEYAKNPPPPPLPPPPVNQQPGKKKKKKNNQNQQQLRAPVSYFGNEKFREERDGVDYRWCPLTHQIDSLIDLMKFGDDSQHTENMAKYAMDLTYRSVASFSVSSEIATKFCLPQIANQFISGKCYDNDGEQTYIVTLRKSNGGTFKLVHFRPEKDSDSTNPYEFFKIHILDPAENVFEKECFGSDDCLVQNAVQKHISGLEELSFESLCNSVMCIVFLRGYLINIRKDENPCESVMNQSVWENIEIPTRRRKTLSASIEPAQIGDVEDLDPLTIFWVDEEPTTHHQYGDVAETRNPKIKDQVYGFVLDLIAEYRSIQRDSIFSQKYRALQDSMRFYSDGIGDVYDFEYKEKNLYYVKGKYDFHYCAIVCGFEDIVICGKAAGEIFYWTPFCYFRSGKKEDKEKCTDDEEKRTDHDVSHLEPLKELKEVTFDKVLDNIEEFFTQFM